VRLTIRTKLLGSYGILIALMVVVATLGILRLQEAAARTDAMYVENVQGVQHALLTNQAMIASAREEKRAFLEPEGATRTRLIAESRAWMSDAEQSMVAYEATYDSEADRLQWEAVVAEVNPVIAARHHVLDLLEQGQYAEALEASVVMGPAIASMNAALTQTAGFNEQLAADAVQTAATMAASARTLMIALTFIAAAAGLALGWWISRGITSGVSKMGRAAQGIAGGDLEQDVSVSSKDEIGDMAQSFGRMKGYLAGMATAAERIADGDMTVEVVPQSSKDALGNSFKQMVDNLNDVLTRAQQTSVELSSAKAELETVSDEAARATTEVARASSQVAEGTNQQAQAVTEINESVTELSRMIAQVTADASRQSDAIEEAARLSAEVASSSEQMARGAQTASQGAQAASTTAKEGAQSVQATVEGITRLQEKMDAASQEIGTLGDRSQEIGKIVAVIQDIAAQTNLLALNAAIEAARAGEQGRGFAVVADEVRQLAERVASATKEIGSLIDGVRQSVDASVRAMDDGVAEMQTSTEAAAEAGGALSQILRAVDEAADQITQIAAGAEQLKGAGVEMAQRIDDVGRVAAENRVAAQSMTERAGTVTASIESIAAVAEENSASTEEVSASAEEMSAQVEQITASTGELGRMADSLRDQIASFRLRGQGGRANLAVVSDSESGTRSAA